MNDAALVGHVEPHRDVPGDRDRFGQTDSVLRDSFGERRALDEFEDEHLDARGVFFKAVNLPDVGVVERRQRLRFAHETRPATGIVLLYGAKNLQRYITVQFRVARAIDFAHATNAQQRDDLVGADASTQGERQTRGLYVLSNGASVLMPCSSKALTRTGRFISERVYLVTSIPSTHAAMASRGKWLGGPTSG
jgi:hypothetical protein